MLVPFLDNANHASQADGGGHFQIGSSCITPFAGEQGVKKGEAVTLDYGKRSESTNAGGPNPLQWREDLCFICHHQHLLS